MHYTELRNRLPFLFSIRIKVFVRTLHTPTFIKQPYNQICNSDSIFRLHNRRTVENTKGCLRSIK